MNFQLPHQLSILSVFVDGADNDQHPGKKFLELDNIPHPKMGCKIVPMYAVCVKI